MNNKALLILTVIVLLLVGAFALFERQERSAALARAAASESRVAEAQAKATELERTLATSQGEIAKLKAQSEEVYRLRNEVSMLKKAKADLEKRERQLAAQANRANRKNENPPPAPTGTKEETVLPAQFANFEEMTRTVADLRNKAFHGQLSETEKAYLRQLEPQLKELQKSPAEFAAFQSAMIQSATGITNPATLDQIRGIIERTYQSAVVRGIAVPDDTAAQAGDNSSWQQQRDQLNRRATGAVQKIMTDSERASFNQVFKGVMGVDLGLEPAAPREAVPPVPTR